MHQQFENMAKPFKQLYIMKNLVNAVTLLGNVGIHPEVRILSNGKKMAIISLATGERRRDKEGKFQRHVTWHKLVAWGKTADLVEHHVGKGQRLLVEGKLVKYQWAGAGGEARKANRVAIDRLFFINRKNKAEAVTEELPF